MSAVDVYASWRRCPKTTCGDYGKRLTLDVGAHESHGELTVRHSCLACGYAEEGPRTPEAARRSSGTVAALLYRQRLEGTAVRLLPDTTPWPEEAL